MNPGTQRHQQDVPFLVTSLVYLLILQLLLCSTPSSVLAAQVCGDRYAQFFRSFEPRGSDMPPLTVGIEIEGEVPNAVGMRGVAKAVAARLQQHYKNVQIQPNTRSYRVYFGEREQKNFWTIEKDASIRASQTPVEISTPILKGPKDQEIFNEVLGDLRQLGFEARPASSGVHVHVGFDSAKGGEVAALAATFSEIENELRKRFSVARTRNHYIQATSDSLMHTLNQGRTDDPTGYLYRLQAAQDRYHALNLKALDKQGTIEFRLFNSTLNPEAIELMQDFSTRLVEGIRSQDPVLVKYLTHSKGEIDLDKVARILKMKIAHPAARKALKAIEKEARKEALRVFAIGHRGELSADTLLFNLICGASIAGFITRVAKEYQAFQERHLEGAESQGK
jgi:hypothetical protein